MAESVDDLTFNYTNEEGQLVRKQLDKEVLSKGAWATVMYLYQDLDRRSNTYRVPKISIVRYRKSNGVYRKQSSFNISSERQGRHIVEVLEKWYSPDYDDSPGNVKKRKAEDKGNQQAKAEPSQPGGQSNVQASSATPSEPERSQENQGASTPAATEPSSDEPSEDIPPWKRSF
jgi:hypothetical protein